MVVASASQQGRRGAMEDVIAVHKHVSLRGDAHRTNGALCCVLDGHGGRACAAWCADALPRAALAKLRAGERRREVCALSPGQPPRRSQKARATSGRASGDDRLFSLT